MPDSDQMKDSAMQPPESNQMIVETGQHDIAASHDEVAQNFRCGYIGIVGRPNTGKSSLFNELIGSHISGVSPKAQTTRTSVAGWLNLNSAERAGQLVFLDTPGLTDKNRSEVRFGLKQETTAVFGYAHALLMMVDCRRWQAGDDEMLNLIGDSYRGSVVLVMNKIDLLAGKEELLPCIARHAQRYDWSAILPVSVTRNNGLDRVVGCLWQHLPLCPPFFSTGVSSHQSLEETASEHIRENVYYFLHQEIPYHTGVQVQSIDHRDGGIHIHAQICPDRRHRRSIVIGRSGRTLALIRRRSETSLQEFIGGSVKVFVHLDVVNRTDSPSRPD
ncbi:MAG: GTPase Era [Gammaproteobacteria bacterium]|nr:GTPase Era [Gammaproteobacteria bacterium]